MKQTKLVMGMPVSVEVIDEDVTKEHLDKIFAYFVYVDNKFSTYKASSEISLINAGKLTPSHYSHDMKMILRLAEETKRATDGYFDISHAGTLDPSGIVKGWAINNAASLFSKMGFKNFFVEAGGDIQTSGLNKNGQPWRVGIRNPFRTREIVKVLSLTGQGIATSGTYERGSHIYNPKTGQPASGIVSLTVIGLNVYEADRFTTAAFAMGQNGLAFLAQRGFEAYSIATDRTAEFTTGLNAYILNSQ